MLSDLIVLRACIIRLEIAPLMPQCHTRHFMLRLAFQIRLRGFSTLSQGGQVVESILDIFNFNDGLSHALDEPWLIRLLPVVQARELLKVAPTRITPSITRQHKGPSVPLRWRVIAGGPDTTQLLVRFACCLVAVLCCKEQDKAYARPASTSA